MFVSKRTFIHRVPHRRCPGCRQQRLRPAGGSLPTRGEPSTSQPPDLKRGQGGGPSEAGTRVTRRLRRPPRGGPTGQSIGGFGCSVSCHQISKFDSPPSSEEIP